MGSKGPLKKEDVIGRKVYLCGDHPWAGHVGEVVGFDDIGMRVKLLDVCGETEAGVISPRHFVVLPDEYGDNRKSNPAPWRPSTQRRGWMGARSQFDLGDD